MIISSESEFMIIDDLIFTNWSEVPQDYYYMLGLKNVRPIKNN